MTAADDTALPVNGKYPEVELAPGAGAQIKLGAKRGAHAPTLDRSSHAAIPASCEPGTRGAAVR